ncbi:MAG: glycosyltransferase family 39 protein [Ignavibacteriae bacterium]|nr:glycosyltransferase family 39 protein [Ignavibacteriota bacterium]
MSAAREARSKSARRVSARDDRRVSTAAAQWYAVATAALGLRLFFLYQFADTPFYTEHVSDSKIYLALAEAIRNGALPAKAWFMSPLYPYLLALLGGAGDPNLLARLVQCLLGAATAVMTGMIAARLWNTRAGLAAGLLVAVSPELLFYDTMLLTESLLAFSLTAHLAVLLRLEKYGRPRDAVVSGLALGVALVTRFSLILYPVLLAAVYMRGRTRGTAPALRLQGLLAASALLVIIPFTIRNALVEGVFVPVTSAGGYNFHAGNNGSAQGWYNVPEGVDIAKDPNGELEAERALGRALTSSETSSYWFSVAGRWISDNPVRFMGLLGRKVLLFFHPADIEQTGLSMGFIRREYGTLLDLPLPPFLVLLGFAITGYVFVLRARRGAVVPPVLFAAFVLSTALFFIAGRFRVPLIPVLAVYGGIAAQEALCAVREKRFMPLMQSAGIGLGTVLLLVVAQPSFTEVYEREYQTLGDMAFRNREYTKAELLFTRSLAERPTPDVYVNRGNALAATGRIAEALPMYDSALALRPRHTLALFNRGNALMQAERPEQAYQAWFEAARSDPNFGPAHRNMGILLLRAGRAAEAAAALERAASHEQDAAVRETILRDAATARALAQAPRK